jgi:tetratricopeptide (TPR) repeat protein
MHRLAACIVILGAVAPAQANDALDDVSARVTKFRTRLIKPPPELGPAEGFLKQARIHMDAAADAEARVQVRDPDATNQAKKALAEQRSAGRALNDAVKKLDAAMKRLGPGDRAAIQDAVHAADALSAFWRGDPAHALKLMPAELLTQFPSLKRYQGLAAASAGQRDLAWSALSTAPLDPTDVPAQLALGQLAEARKDWESARKAYGNAYAAAPADHTAGVGLCMALIALGRANEARAPLAMLTEGGKDQRATYLLAVLAERDGNAKRVEELLARVVGIEPSTEPPQPDQSYRRPGRSLYVTPLDPPWGTLPPDLDPGAAAAHLGARWLARGDAQGAVKALKSAPTAEALYVRGLAERYLGRYDDAKLDFKRASELAPERHEPRCAWGVSILDSGDAATAQEELELDGDHPPSMVAEAVALSVMGHQDKARAELTKLINEKGAVGDAARTNLAALERAGGHLDAALKALPDKPMTATGWLLRGLVLDAMGQKKPAMTALRAAVQAAPAYVDAWLALGKSAEQSGDSTVALEAAGKVLSIDPTHGEAKAMKGRVAGKSKR